MKKIRWGVLSTANIVKEQVIPAILCSEHAELIGIASERGKAKYRKHVLCEKPAALTGSDT